MEKPLTYIDLFAGASGLSEGFVNEGFVPIAHVEKNKDACLTIQTRVAYHYLKEQGRLDEYYDYLKKWSPIFSIKKMKANRHELYKLVPKEKLDTVINAEISDETINDIFQKIDNKLIQNKIESVDLIIGGPPCQAYSSAGKARMSKAKDRKTDKRLFLYKEYLKFIDKYKPNVFVFENVPGILSAKHEKETDSDCNMLFIDMITRAFASREYKLEYRILDSSTFGVMQKRLRVVIIGWKKDVDFHYPIFENIDLGNCTITQDLFTLKLFLNVI